MTEFRRSAAGSSRGDLRLHRSSSFTQHRNAPDDFIRSRSPGFGTWRLCSRLLQPLSNTVDTAALVADVRNLAASTAIDGSGGRRDQVRGGQQLRRGGGAVDGRPGRVRRARAWRHEPGCPFVLSRRGPNSLSPLPWRWAASRAAPAAPGFLRRSQIHTARRVDFHQQRQHGRAVPGASKNWRTLSQMLLSSVSYLATQVGIKTRFTSDADLVLELGRRSGRAGSKWRCTGRWRIGGCWSSTRSATCR